MGGFCSTWRAIQARKTTFGCCRWKRAAEPANPFHCFKLRFRKSIRSFPKICAGSATFRTNPAVMKLTCVRFWLRDHRGAPVLGDGKWQISKDGAQSLFWRDDGKEIVLLGLDGSLSSVEISTSPAFRAGSPQPMFRVPTATASLTATRDLKRFLLAVPPGEPEKP